MFDQLVPYLPFATILASGGVAWGVSKQKVARTEQDVQTLYKAMEKHSRNHNSAQTSVTDRLARIETKLDILLGDK